MNIGCMRALTAMNKNNDRDRSSSPELLDLTHNDESKIAEPSQEYSFAPPVRSKMAKDIQTVMNSSTTKTNTFTNV